MTEMRAPDGWPVVLASGSPRRRALLEGAGLPVVVAPPDVDERLRPGESPVDFAGRMAREKARRGAKAWREGPAWILASDTVVALEGRVLGKPEGARDAEGMLASLSGRAHEVVTAWHLVGPGDVVRFGASIAVVRFRELSPDEIGAYVETGEPLDKAGAYGVQGAAVDFVASLTGDYDAVVGLPLAPVLSALREVGALGVRDEAALRLAVIRGRLRAAEVFSGRPVGSTRLVAVSKGRPAAAVAALREAGQAAFGENYVQEWTAKRILAGPGVEWHLVGRLQSNKASVVAEHAEWVHGVDSTRLVTALDRAAGRAGRRLSVLIQVNVDADPAKGGVTLEALPALVEAAAGASHLRLCGLMTIPAAGGRAEARRAFARLRRARDAHARPGLPLSELSMGMSGDFEQAVSEGATLVRVGTALFVGDPRQG